VWQRVRNVAQLQLGEREGMQKKKGVARALSFRLSVGARHRSKLFSRPASGPSTLPGKHVHGSPVRSPCPCRRVPSQHDALTHDTYP